MKNNLTLTLTCGLPRSGKSTYIKKHIKNDVIVCPDRIRKLIFGHQFHKEAEDFVWAYAKGMAKLILEQGKNVLIDATNINLYSREQWYRIAKDYNAKIRVIWIKTSLKECIKRNAKSPEGERLPEDMLIRMAQAFENPVEDNSEGLGCKVKIAEIPYKGRYTKIGQIWGVCGNIYREEVRRRYNG